MWPFDWFRRKGWIGGSFGAGPARGTWEASASEKSVVNELLTFLEDRECLSAAYDREFEGQVMRSVILMREEFTNILKRLPIPSSARDQVETMRAAARQFMRSTPEPIDRPFTLMRDEYRDALTEMREGFRTGLEGLEALGFLRAGELARSIPHHVDAPRFDPASLQSRIEEVDIRPPPERMD
jgi:hypothetical protein